MARPYARARYLSATRGHNGVAYLGYLTEEELTCERTNETFSFRRHNRVDYSAGMLPDGAPERFADHRVLWNAVDQRETRVNAQIARELVLALPRESAITRDDRIALTRSFVEEHFVSKGLGAHIAIHKPVPDPTGARAGSATDNWHAHVLLTTRRIEPDGLARKKARDLDPVFRSDKGGGHVVEKDHWGKLWGDHQDAYFRDQGLTLRVDPTNIQGQVHLGPTRMRHESHEESETAARARAIDAANHDAVRDPAQILGKMTARNATFTRVELDRFLEKHYVPGPGETMSREDMGRAVLSNPEAVALYDGMSGEATGRYTTATVRAQEQAVMEAAAGLAAMASGAVSEENVRRAAAGRTLRADQRRAFDYAVGDGHLKLIEGRAGTGKSYTLSAIREAHERDGKTVIGLGPTHAVVQDMKKDGFAQGRTVHSMVYRLDEGQERWTPDTVVMVDEAGMLDARRLGTLVAHAGATGAKLILVGDDRQLGSIERGGVFSEMLARHPTSELTDVTRQEEDWQRAAARDLADYRFDRAIDAFDRHGAIHWAESEDAACAALVQAWRGDLRVKPDESRFVFAYTNRDVDQLNAALRGVWREQGMLQGDDMSFATARPHPTREDEEIVRHADFAVGDRIQFTQSDPAGGIFNGNIGTIVAIDHATRRIVAQLDGVKGAAGRVGWGPGFRGFRHGYAGTIYKGQGKTIDRTYLYHTDNWTSAPAYVALTRQRKLARLFASHSQARNARELAEQMSRYEVRRASLAWATRADLARDTGPDHVPDHVADPGKPRDVATPVAGGPPPATESDGGVDMTPELAAGQARFRRRYSTNRLQGDAEKEAQDLVDRWDQIFERYKSALPKFDEGGGYPPARDELVGYARALSLRRRVTAMLVDRAADFGVDERPTLRRILAAPDARQAADAIVAESEGAERARRADRARQDAAAQRRTPTRPRDGRGR